MTYLQIHGAVRQVSFSYKKYFECVAVQHQVSVHSAGLLVSRRKRC